MTKAMDPQPGRRGIPRWRRAATLAAAAMLALSLAGLGGALASADGGATASRAASVRIEGFTYEPATLRIAKGTSVSFANASGTAHTATRKGSFTTGRIKPGKAATIRFAQRGSFAYHCTIHPFMRGKVVVD